MLKYDPKKFVMAQFYEDINIGLDLVSDRKQHELFHDKFATTTHCHAIHRKFIKRKIH